MTARVRLCDSDCQGEPARSWNLVRGVELQGWDSHLEGHVIAVEKSVASLWS